jgi:hypothetical protein
MKNLNQKILFIHNPKTGGTSLNYYIFCKFFNKRRYKITAWEKEKADFIKYKHRNSLKIIHGHFPFGIHNYIEAPYTYITILRNPIQRLISYYYYMLAWPSHFPENPIASSIQKNNYTIEEFIQKTKSENCDNGQTRLISGINPEFGKCTSEMLEIAKKNLKNEFSVVGITERYDETLAVINFTLKWKSYHIERNVATNKKKDVKISQTAREALTKYNEFDLQLYDYANELLDISLKNYTTDELNKAISRITNPGLYKEFLKIRKIYNLITQDKLFQRFINALNKSRSIRKFESK